MPLAGEYPYNVEWWYLSKQATHTAIAIKNGVTGGAHVICYIGCHADTNATLTIKASATAVMEYSITSATPISHPVLMAFGVNQTASVSCSQATNTTLYIAGYTRY